MQAPLSAADDDRFDHPDVAELTIELDDIRIRGMGGSALSPIAESNHAGVGQSRG